MKNSYLEKIKSYLPFILLFGIFILIHLNLRQVGDDLTYSQVFLLGDYNNIIPLIIERYFTWSSRFIIEYNLMVLSILPMKVWKVLDSVILVLIGIITVKFFTTKYSFKNKNLINGIISSILVLIFFYVSYGEIITCGGISVSLNYIWPIFFILLHFYILKKYILENNMKKQYEKIIIYFFLIFSLIFACNHEQGLLIFLILYSLIITNFLYKKEKISKIFYLLIFLIIVEGAIIFLAPGNQLRYEIEIVNWFPEYINLNLFNKIDLGFLSFYKMFLADNNILCLLFLFVFGIYNYFISKNFKIGVISSIPFIICFSLNLLLLLGFKDVTNLFGGMNYTYGLFGSDLIHILFFMLLYVIMAACMFYGIWQIKKFKGNKIAISIFILLSLGFITSFLAGFTPTMWPSRGRMFIFLYGSLYFATYILISDLINKKLEEKI